LSQSPSQKSPKNGNANEKRQVGDLGLAQKANELVGYIGIITLSFPNHY